MEEWKNGRIEAEENSYRSVDSDERLVYAVS